MEEAEKDPSLPYKIPPSAVANNRTQKVAFEIHSCNLPGNIMDKDEMVKAISLKSECKCETVGRHLDSSQWYYGLNSATKNKNNALNCLVICQVSS